MQTPTARELWEDAKALFCRGEYRCARYGISGRVYKRLPFLPEKVSTGQNKMTVTMTMTPGRVYSSQHDKWYDSIDDFNNAHPERQLQE